MKTGFPIAVLLILCWLRLLLLPSVWVLTFSYIEIIKAALALPLGHLLACFSDTFTKQGVQLFYPEPVWAVSVSNPRRRLKTGGAGELWVLGAAISLRHALRVPPYLSSGFIPLPSLSEKAIAKILMVSLIR